MSFRLVALDLDGTLLDSHLRIRPQSLAAIAQLRRRGVEVMLVTGRHHAAAAPYHRALGLELPAVCCNGTYLYDYARHTALMPNPLSRTQALFLLRKVRESGVHALMYIEDTITYERIEPHLARLLHWIDTEHPGDRAAFTHVARFEDVAISADVVWKFALTHPTVEPLQVLVAEVEREMGLACEWSGSNRVDIAQGGNSKGALLGRWLDAHDIPHQAVIAFGDSPNDISMLKLAGMGVAMGGCADIVRHAADWQIGSNDSDAIARALEQVFA
ncbi:pyridoxal phosphatase [Niveibacterium umoris]|uniref:Pyridoxal phosphatase n=1 Tax=Niveibacterium umoris TaxID=1193620 RepID=A0A840BRR3_9RHOO|nr:pyridoxal phosphatase [Niveibacterium umoris]MBB4013087.1 hypothetical protein [Niveibacterium umoris]